MQITTDKNFSDLGEMIGEFIGGKSNSTLMAGAKKATSKMEMGIGLSDMMPDDGGLSRPFYADQAVFGQAVMDGGSEVLALVEAAGREGLSETARRQALSHLTLNTRYNRETGKFDKVWGKARPAGVSDAAPDLVAAQLASPGSVGYFTDIFRKPLIWSNARKLAEMYTGDNPWAEMMTLITEDYSGFAALMNAGSLNNNASADVEVQDGLMTQPVMNAWVSYRISIEELERSKNPNSRFPFNGQPISFKQSYANWALDLALDYSIIFGIPQAGINGLLQVNGVTAWPTDSLTVIAAGVSATKGHDMYIALAKQVAAFLSTSKNMLKRVRISMSPEALNLFSIYNYSDVYNPETPIVTFIKNFLAGEGKGGTTPDVEIFSDPLLSAGTIFRSAATDLLIITAPEIVGGPDDQSQALVRFGMPLPKFMYPVVPGQYGTPFKTLFRFAGIFAPYTPAVKVFSGFGV
jgi:hypothetical protein